MSSKISEWERKEAARCSKNSERRSKRRKERGQETLDFITMREGAMYDSTQ